MANTLQMDAFHPRTLRRVIEMPELRAKSFLRDRYFGTVETFPTQAIDFDVIGYGDRKMAKFINPRLGGTYDHRDGYKVQSFVPGYLAPTRVTTAEDAMLRLPGENLYNSGEDPNTRAAKILARDLHELDVQISRREEQMASEALFTGKQTVRGEGVDRVVNFWPADAAQKPTSTVSTLWSNSSAEPINDLRTICRGMAQKSGLTPVEMICGSRAIDCMLDRLKGDSSAINSRRIDMGAIDPRTLGDGVSMIGTLKYPSLDILTYDEWYMGEDGTEHPMVPADSILIACRGVQTTRAYGMVDIVDVANNTHAWVVGDRVPNSWLQHEPMSGRVIQIKSAPLMIIHEIYGFYVLKVV